MLLTVVTWKWRPQPDARPRHSFAAEHVNVLRSMVARHCRLPHKFVCITDDPVGIDPRIRIIPLWADHGDLVNPSHAGGPSCYRRLKIFSAEMRNLLGPRIVSLDLDTLIVGDVTPLWDRPEEFVIWGDTTRNTPYNGSMFLLTAGSRRRVWEEFDPKRSPARGRELGYFGSDQAWIGACLGPGEAMWSRADGVLSFRNHIGLRRAPQPADARIVFFHGAHKPWSGEVRRVCPWVAEHWR